MVCVHAGRFGRFDALHMTPLRVAVKSFLNIIFQFGLGNTFICFLAESEMIEAALMSVQLSKLEDGWLPSSTAEGHQFILCK